jgi:hypothetical protein
MRTLNPVPLIHKCWQFHPGDKVRLRGKADDSSAVVLDRLPGLPFPHYEVMDDEGYVVRVAQLELTRIKP